VFGARDPGDGVQVIFDDVEQFVTAHRGMCGELTADVGEVTDAGYNVWLTCSCGAVFDRWVTSEAAEVMWAWSRSHPDPAA
jgi:hypothetical protein